MKEVLVFAVFALVINTIYCKPYYPGIGSIGCGSPTCQPPCPGCAPAPCPGCPPSPPPVPCPPVNCPPPPLPCPPVSCPAPQPPPSTNCNVCSNYGSVGLCCPPYNSFTPWYGGASYGGGYGAGYGAGYGDSGSYIVSNDNEGSIGLSGSYPSSSLKLYNKNVNSISLETSSWLIKGIIHWLRKVIASKGYDTSN
ncbi:hypothetical protein QE152_g6234 [Popillia japonica]|uniref:Uncharacterized protein n=1 Tax=Popillia japonica TaxID=7064 RepID=A0AAW1MHI8_POPJA